MAPKRSDGWQKRSREIAKRRKRLGISRPTLARAAKIASGTVANIEWGVCGRGPTLTRVELALERLEKRVTNGKTN